MSYFKAILLSSNSNANDLTGIIVRVVDEKKPQSVVQLITILKESLNLEEKEIIESVLKLQAEGVIKLEDQASQAKSLSAYLKTRKAAWYWTTIAVEAMTAAVIFTISENNYPWTYARNILGIPFVLFFPGFAFIEALFPVNNSAKTTAENLFTVERIALSIAMSMALVAIVGLLLNFSPWGLDLTAMILSLLVFTSIFATIAVFRKHQLLTMVDNVTE
jgi:uncharacterized membrane protein